MLRDGIPADAEAIEYVRIAAWRAAYKECMPAEYLAKLDTLQNIEGLRVRLASQDIDFSLSVAEERNAIVAFSILGKPRYEAPSDTMELRALNVHPQYWRKSFGLQLTKRAIASAKTAGFKRIELWCINGNRPAEAAYEHAGFTPTERERISSNLTGSPIHERQYSRKL